MKSKFVNNYIVFDVETTGLDPLSDRLIEIGAIKYVEGKKVEEFSYLINPECPIPSIITQITGIDDTMVKDAKTIQEVLPSFLEFIKGFPLVAHNASFDISFINEALYKNHLSFLENDVIDTLEMSKIYIPKAYNHKLETLKKYFHLDFNSHRSIEDCLTTNAIYEEMKKRAKVTL